MPRTIVAMNAQGRVTLPAEIRRRLDLGEGDQLEVTVEDDRISLRRARVVVAEDAWAYTTKSLRSIRRALDDLREGRSYRLSEDELLAGRYPRRAPAGRPGRARGAR